MHVLDLSAIAPADRPGEDVLRDFVTTLWEESVKHVRIIEGIPALAVSSIAVNLAYDDALLVSAERFGQHDIADMKFYWWLKGVEEKWTDGRKVWVATYRVDVE